MKSKSSFKHEAMLETKAISQFLDAFKKALMKGQLHFSDEKGELVLSPEKVMYLKVKASNEDGRQQVDMKLRWDTVPEELSTQAPDLKSKSGE